MAKYSECLLREVPTFSRSCRRLSSSNRRVYKIFLTGGDAHLFRICRRWKAPTFSRSCRRLGGHLWIQGSKKGMFYNGWCPPFPEVVAGCHRQMEGLRPAVRTGWHHKTRRLLSSRHTSHPNRSSLLKRTKSKICVWNWLVFFYRKESWN